MNESIVVPGSRVLDGIRDFVIGDLDKGDMGWVRKRHAGICTGMIGYPDGPCCKLGNGIPCRPGYAPGYVGIYNLGYNNWWMVVPEAEFPLYSIHPGQGVACSHWLFKGLIRVPDDVEDKPSWAKDKLQRRMDRTRQEETRRRERDRERFRKSWWGRLWRL